MGAKDLADLLSQVGLDESLSASEKRVFCEVVNDVLDPPVTVSLLLLAPEQSEGAPVQQETDELLSIAASRTVFRTHFRRSPYIDFGAAKEEAFADFQIGFHQQMTSDPAIWPPEKVNKVYDQRVTEADWISKMNSWKRDNFKKSAMEGGVGKLRLQIWDKFPSDVTVNESYGEEEIPKFADGAVADLVKGFLEEIPAFEEKAQVEEWCQEFRQQLSQVVDETLERNQRKKETWEAKLQEAVTKYKEVMGKYFAKRQFVVSQCKDFILEAKHKGAANVAVEETGIRQFLMDHVMRAQWEAKLKEEHRLLKEEWEAEGDKKVHEFKEAFKAEGRRLFEEKFKCNIYQDDLEALLSKDFSEHVKRTVEDEEEYQCKLEMDFIPDCTSTTSEEPSGDDYYDDNGSGDNLDKYMIKSTLEPIVIHHRSKCQVVFPGNTELPSPVFHLVDQTSASNEMWGHLHIYEGDDPEPNPTRGTTSTDLGSIFFGHPPRESLVETLDIKLQMDSMGLLSVISQVRGDPESAVHKDVKTSTWRQNKAARRKAREEMECAGSSNIPSSVGEAGVGEAQGGSEIGEDLTKAAVLENIKSVIANLSSSFKN